MWHIYSKYLPKDPGTLRRNLIAQQSWQRQLWVEVPITDDEVPQLWVEGDRKFPFVRAFFDQACKGRDDQDIIVYTNSDIICRSDTAMVIAAAMQDVDACYCFRRDFNHRVECVPTDAEFMNATPYAGSDLYAFRVVWWKVFRNDFPDLIFGYEAWDACLRHLINMTNPGAKTELKDLICHERHASRWEDPLNRRTLPGQIHCLREAFKWLVDHGINPAQHGIVMP